MKVKRRSAGPLPGTPEFFMGDRKLDRYIAAMETDEIEEFLLSLLGEQFPEIEAEFRLSGAFMWACFVRRRGDSRRGPPYFIVLRYPHDRRDITLGYVVEPSLVLKIRVAIRRIGWHGLGIFRGNRRQDGRWQLD